MPRIGGNTGLSVFHADEDVVEEGLPADLVGCFTS